MCELFTCHGTTLRRSQPAPYTGRRPAPLHRAASCARIRGSPQLRYEGNDAIRANHTFPFTISEQLGLHGVTDEVGLRFYLVQHLGNIGVFWGVTVIPSVSAQNWLYGVVARHLSTSIGAVSLPPRAALHPPTACRVCTDHWCVTMQSEHVCRRTSRACYTRSASRGCHGTLLRLRTLNSWPPL